MKKLVLGLFAGLLVSLAALGQVPSPSTYTTTTVTVTNASAQVLAANYTRRYLAIQNFDGAAILYCTTAATATTTNGVVILAGQMWVPWLTPSNRIACISSTASNTNVLLIEGN